MAKAKELQFGVELVKILDIYTEDNFSKGDKEPLDSDEVESLTKILKAQLEYLNGNVTEKEYNNMLELPKVLTATNKVYLTSITDKQDNDVVKYALLLANDEFVKKVSELTKLAKENDTDIINGDLVLTSNFFMVTNKNQELDEITMRFNDAKMCAIEEFEGDWVDCYETEISPTNFEKMYEKLNWNDESKVIITKDGFYLIEETETDYFETEMIDLSEITE